MGTRAKNRSPKQTAPLSIGALLYLERCNQNETVFDEKTLRSLESAGRRARAGHSFFEFIGGAR